MASHAQTFFRIQVIPIIENQGFISCDSNSNATIAPLANNRGEHSTKIQGWEIIDVVVNNIPLVRFRNPLGVFLGVDEIANNNVVKASAGLDEKSLWKLESNGKISISIGTNTFYMQSVSNGIKIVAINDPQYQPLWNITVHNLLPLT